MEESIAGMSSGSKVKTLFSHVKAFMVGVKTVIDICVTTGMISNINVNNESKIPSCALLYTMDKAVNDSLKRFKTFSVALDARGLAKISESGLKIVKLQITTDYLTSHFISGYDSGSYIRVINFEGTFLPAGTVVNGTYWYID